ncbi:MAG: hypothetical protein FWF88_00165 [Peptococcaceae bacterium]|nr:hypothetical protein [Peptococcaceae bacterium]
MANDTLRLRHAFDKERCRHEINGLTAVLHCHHFASLTTQLANDCQLLDAKKLLMQCAEDTFHLVLTDYYQQNAITGIEERLHVGEQYFAEVGLGKLKVSYAGPYSGEVVLEHSHLDEGWIKKWGRTDKPINYVGCGFVCALFAAAYNRNRREYTALELQSIARGADVSVIRVMDVTDSGGK